MPDRQEEVLFNVVMWDSSQLFPVTLIKYDSGKFDLHCQTGEKHKDAISRAKKILSKRNMVVGKMEMIGPTGAYYPVTLSLVDDFGC